MKKLFYYLLKRYTKKETDRLKVFKILHDQVENEYREQTTFGNIYNANIEFIMSQKFINRLVEEDYTESLQMVKRGLNNSFDEAIKFLEDDYEKSNPRTYNV